MGKNKINPDHFVYNQCDDGGKLLALAKRSPNVEVRQQGTSHGVVNVVEGDYRGESFVIPDHELGVGLACKAWKWLVRVGIIGGLIAGTIYLIMIVQG